MRKTFKYRLRPNKAQLRQLENSLELCGWVYNETLAVRRNTYEDSKENISLYQTNKLLPGWKKERPELKAAHSQVLANAQVRVDLAFKAFFRRVKAGETPGYPRFKGKGRYDSITYPQYGNGALLDGTRLKLSKIGVLKIVLHRPFQGEIKTVTIIRQNGKWYACFSCEVEPPGVSQTSGQAVGIDVGLASFATFSSGEKIESPRFFRKDEKALAKAQRKLSKFETGTPERLRSRKVVGRIHERVANRRKDFAHKLSRRLVNDFALIAFENLDIKDMQDGNFRSMNKSIADAAWSQLVSYTTYKAENAGCRVVLVDPRNTSKACSRCSSIVPKALNIRTHNCPICGLVLDRDENAAINILRLGLQSLGNQSLEAHAL
ncbi:MAG: transposase [Candidatus Aquicultor sp.]|nr:transposase [Candidatus Aquicultor sp.]